MQTTSLTWLKKLMATAMLTALLVIPAIPTAQAQILPIPDITAVSATPDPYDPQDGVLTVGWTFVDEPGWVEVHILDNGNVVHQVMGQTFFQPGTYSRAWDGMINGNPAPAGTYTAEVKAYNSSGTDIVTDNFSLTYATQQNPPNITGDFASPNPFDPNNETTTVTYTQDSTADIDIVIKDSNGNIIETLVSVNDRNAGTYSQEIWDGRNGSNNPFAEGTYTYEIFATNGGGTDLETGTITIDYDGGNGSCPVITNDYSTPNPFDPDDENTRIYFTLSQSSDVTVAIEDNGSTIRTLTSNTPVLAGTSNVTWDGRNTSGSQVGEDTYTYRITATDNGCTDIETGSVTVDYDGNGGNLAPDITGDYAQPNPFDPDDEDTTIRFTLNTSADITIEIQEDGLIVDTIRDDVTFSSGDHAVTWDGRDRFADKVNDDIYTYRIYAENSYGDDVETGTVEVDRDGSNNFGNLLSNVNVNNDVFDPSNGERSTVCFDILKDNTDITVEVIVSNNTVVRTLLDDVELDEQDDRCYTWDGDDRYGNRVNDAVYEFRVRADRNNETEVEFEFVEVDTDGSFNGFGGDCGGFNDINADSPLCRAIELMYFRGIFSGYADGSFRPFVEINRAEATKVVLLALDYNINGNNGNAGFWDVISGAWYTPYLNTARNYGIIDGYPDRSFRPEGYINRVELLKIFLEASDINVPACNYAPYVDTPVNSDTRWYIDYACFAKAYGLMNTDEQGNFNPAEPMTRGDVADLFYQFETRGLPYGLNNNYYNDYYNNYNQNNYNSPYGYSSNNYNNYNNSYYNDPYNNYNNSYYNDPYNNNYNSYNSYNNSYYPYY